MADKKPPKPGANDHVVVRGFLDGKTGERYEPGAVVNDLADTKLKELVARGAVEKQKRKAS